MLDLEHSGRVRIYYCPVPVDMRKSFDGLAGVVEDRIKQNPESGHIFLFIGKRRNLLKMLQWQDGGFVIWMKRLEAGGFHIPEKVSGRVEISEQELSAILYGIKVDGFYKRYEKKTKKVQF